MLNFSIGIKTIQKEELAKTIAQFGEMNRYGANSIT